MVLIENVLKGLDNKRLLKNKRDPETPIGRLIIAYERICTTDDNLPKFNNRSTVRDLKDALLLVPTEALVVLLYNFVRDNGYHTDTIIYGGPNTMAEQKLKHWFFKVMVGTFIVLMLMLAGAVIAVGVRSGDIKDNPFTGTIFQTAVQILKILFSSDFLKQ